MDGTLGEFLDWNWAIGSRHTVTEYHITWDLDGNLATESGMKFGYRSMCARLVETGTSTSAFGLGLVREIRDKLVDSGFWYFCLEESEKKS